MKRCSLRKKIFNGRKCPPLVIRFMSSGWKNIKRARIAVIGNGKIELMLPKRIKVSFPWFPQESILSRRTDLKTVSNPRTRVIATSQKSKKMTTIMTSKNKQDRST